MLDKRSRDTPGRHVFLSGHCRLEEDPSTLSARFLKLVHLESRSPLLQEHFHLQLLAMSANDVESRLLLPGDRVEITIWVLQGFPAKVITATSKEMLELSTYIQA
jgi:hypothetical protein